ncbi:MAG: hypothetical protein IT208_08355 [Chthonomonadales bacterium]|nr:hypothetical protein [Chthonomonadales bacterium]
MSAPDRLPSRADPSAGVALVRPAALSRRPRDISARSVVLSILLVVGMCWWIAYSEVRTGTTEITCTSLPIGVVFALFCVCALNLGVARLLPGWQLSPAELATVYILTAVGSSIAGIGMVGFLTPAIANPVWYTNEPRWREFANAVPALWSPRDPEAVRAFYLGHSTLYEWRHIRAWLPPLLTWGGFLLLLLFMTLCCAAILRRQWIEHERLGFPIVYVPISMTLEPGGFAGLMRGRALQVGFALPIVLQCVNNLDWLFPSLPYIPVKPTVNGPLDLGPRFTSPPWNALGYFPLAFHPNTIGLAYLLSTDVSFSCWFFYLFRKGLEVYCAAAGYGSGGASATSARMPYTQEQGAGAWLCLAGLTVWLARHHVRRVLRGAWRPRSAEDGAEAMTYRFAVVGAAASFAGVVAFAWWGGLPPGASALLMLVFAAYMLALTRIRAEVGTAWHFAPWVTAPELVTRVVGPMNLGVPALGVLAYHTWYNIDYRSMTTPHLFEAYRIADQGRIHPRKLTAAMSVVLAIGFVAACWSVLHLYYVYGAGTAHVNGWRIAMGRIPFTVATGHLAERSVGTDTPGLLGIAAGAGATWLLSVARARFLGWPFHPAGYAVAFTFITDLLWFPFLLGWLAKWVTLRLGGMGAYRRALPFFVGLILGDYVIASIWTLVGIALGIDMYRCFPN